MVNQRVEAAYRKELVLGEDDPVHANPPTLSVLFSDIRRNYFRLYLNFMYFNIGRIVYLQTDVIFPYVLLAPTIIAGKITLGAMNQILNAIHSSANLVSVSHQLVEHDRRTDLDLSAAAGV